MKKAKLIVVAIIIAISAEALAEPTTTTAEADWQYWATIIGGFGAGVAGLVLLFDFVAKKILPYFFGFNERMKSFFASLRDKTQQEKAQELTQKLSDGMRFGDSENFCIIRRLKCKNLRYSVLLIGGGGWGCTNLADTSSREEAMDAFADGTKKLLTHWCEHQERLIYDNEVPPQETIHC